MNHLRPVEFEGTIKLIADAITLEVEFEGTIEFISDAIALEVEFEGTIELIADAIRASIEALVFGSGKELLDVLLPP